MEWHDKEHGRNRKQNEIIKCKAIPGNGMKILRVITYGMRLSVSTYQEVGHGSAQQRTRKQDEIVNCNNIPGNGTGW